MKLRKARQGRKEDKFLGCRNLGARYPLAMWAPFPNSARDTPPQEGSSWGHLGFWSCILSVVHKGKPSGREHRLYKVVQLAKHRADLPPPPPRLQNLAWVFSGSTLRAGACCLLRDPLLLRRQFPLLGKPVSTRSLGHWSFWRTSSPPPILRSFFPSAVSRVPSG